MRCIRVAAYSLTLSLASSSLVAQSNQSPALDAAARAMGGKDRVLAVRTIVMEGTGEQLNFGQNHTPYAESMFEVTSFKRSLDGTNRRWFHDQTRVPRFTTANTTPQRQRYGMDGYTNGVPYNVGANGNMTRLGAAAAADRANEFFYHPVTFMIAAYSSGTERSEEPADAGQRRVRINVGGNKFAMYVDSRTNLPTRIEKIAYQPMLGDVAIWTDLSDWRDVDGVKVPMRVIQRYENLFTISDYRLSSTRINEDVGNLAATDSVRALPPPVAAAPVVAVDTIAPGVWSIAGQTHHTIAIEQSRGVVLVEAPQSEARSLAAIAQARALRPAKPVDVLINTHHHFDHAGGLRAAIAQNLAIMTHAGNRDFYEKVVFPRRHFIQQDALAQNPKQLRLITVNDKHVIADSVRVIEVYPVTGSAHSGSMLIVYLPAERLLIQADLYNPPAANAPAPASFPFAANLLENIQRLGLQVDRVVGIHGRPVPFSEFQAAASRTP